MSLFLLLLLLFFAWIAPISLHTDEVEQQDEHKGGDEAIFLDHNGYASEGSGDNIFVVKNGVIMTPPTINNLKGITREVVIEIIHELGIPFKETNLSIYDLYTADEVFVTGTAAEVCPIVWIDGRVIGDGKPGEITKKIMKEFRKKTEEEGVPIYADDGS